MPAVAEQLAKQFGLDIKRHEPDLAVARGAALFALIAEAARTAGLGAGPDPGPAGMAATEDVAGTLGISTDQAKEMMSRRVATVVPRGFGIKVADQNDPKFHTDPYKARYYIVHCSLPTLRCPPGRARPGGHRPGQSARGRHRGLGTARGGRVGGIADNVRRPRPVRSLVGLPAGSPIELTFSMNETGLLTVHAAEPTSGREVRFDLQIGGMDQGAVDAARAAVARHAVSS